MARIKAALRRYGKSGAMSDSRILNSNRLRIDSEARQVWKDDEPVELTAIEFDLLHALAEHRGQVLTASDAVDPRPGSTLAR